MNVSVIASIPVWKLIHEDWVTNGKDWTKPGFRAVALHRLGVWRMKLPRAIRLPLYMLYVRLYRFIRNLYGIELFCTTRVGRRLMIAHQGGIVIAGNAQIGDDCLIRHNVTISVLQEDPERKAPVLGNRVNIGAGAFILGGAVIGDDVQIGHVAFISGAITIGDRARISPRALVTRDVPSDTTYPDTAPHTSGLAGSQ